MAAARKTACTGAMIPRNLRRHIFRALFFRIETGTGVADNFMRNIHDRVRKGLNVLDYMMLIAEKFQAPGVVGHGQ